MDKLSNFAHPFITRGEFTAPFRPSKKSLKNSLQSFLHDCRFLIRYIILCGTRVKLFN